MDEPASPLRSRCPSVCSNISRPLLPAEGGDFAIAGLLRQHPEVGEAFTLLTAPPGPDVEPYHNRQIVLLRPDQWRSWLDGSARSLGLLRPTPAGCLTVEAAA